jgi:hypothetical protein
MIYINVDTAVTVFVNAMPLLDDTDFKSRETGVAYNAAGMDLVWNFTTIAGVITQTAVTPTTAGDYDWSHVGDAIYKIEIPASGGASINNDTEGFGFFSGIATGVLPWAGPTYGFRPALLNKGLVTFEEYVPVDPYHQDMAVSGSNLTTKKPDGTTSTSYSPKTLTTDAGAVPIIGAS